jgi:hypothetical protein
VEMFVHRGAARVRNTFAQAARLAPCIIFIDKLEWVTVCVFYACSTTLLSIMHTLHEYVKILKGGSRWLWRQQLLWQEDVEILGEECKRMRLNLPHYLCIWLCDIFLAKILLWNAQSVALHDRRGVWWWSQVPTIIFEWRPRSSSALRPSPFIPNLLLCVCASSRIRRLPIAHSIFHSLA